MKRLLLFPALVVGCLLWACDSTSPPTEPEVVVDQTEFMNFVNTPEWPDKNGNGHFCAEDLGGDAVQFKCILFVDKPAICHTNVSCRDDNLKEGDLISEKCILFVDRPDVCIGVCGAKFDLVKTDPGAGDYFNPLNCNGGPPQGS